MKHEISFYKDDFFSVLMYCICKKSYKVTKYIKLDYRILELEYRQYFVAHILEVEQKKNYTELNNFSYKNYADGQYELLIICAA